MFASPQTGAGSGLSFLLGAAPAVAALFQEAWSGTPSLRSRGCSRRQLFPAGHARRTSREPGDQPICQLCFGLGRTGSVDGVDLKDLLRQIEPNARDRATNSE